jgi:hypothetical protein
MADFFLTVAISAGVFIALAFLALDGFRRGDFSGEQLARALRKDLEAATTEHERRRLPDIPEP